MISPDRLAVLRSVDRHGTLAATAAALHRTPSAISQQIRQLSKETGVELLRPYGRGIVLSEAARRLIQYADEVALVWEEAHTDLVKYARNEIGRISICGFATSIAALIAPAARQLQGENPGITVEIHEADVDDSFDRLATGRADLIILPAGHAPSIDEIRFQAIQLFSDSQDVVVSDDHPLAARSSVAIEELRAETWIEPHHDQKDLIRSACQSAGFAPYFRHQADDWNAVISLAAEGFGICLVPKLVAVPQDKQVSRIEVTDPGAVARHTVACVRRGSADQPLISATVKMLDQVAETYGRNVSALSKWLFPKS